MIEHTEKEFVDIDQGSFLESCGSEYSISLFI